MFQQSLLRNHASLGAFFGPLFRGGARTGNYRKAWLLPPAFLALASSPACAEGFSASQKAEIEAIIKEYLLQKPEILREGIGVLDAREKAAETKARQDVVSDPSGLLFSGANQAVMGN